MTPQEQLDHRVASAFFGRFTQIRDLQVAAAKALLKGENLVLAAGTGSGKTEAVLAPLVSRHWRDASKTNSTVIVYVVPTKALVNDLEKRIQLPFSALGLRISVRHGDRDDLVAGQPGHLLLTTPESLDVLLSRSESTLKTVRAVVLDEVHLLYNTQRGLQLSILLRRLRRILAHEFQWAALSATIGDLSNVRDFLFGAQAQATTLRFASTRSIDAQILHMADLKAVAEMVGRLTGSAPTKLLLFADSRKECERLAHALSEVLSLKDTVLAHYSSLSSDVRVETEQRFASARTAVCIATSTLELGIDIGDIDAVSLWGAPGSIESFLQRIGRGNRRAAKANVICLIRDDSTSVIGDTLKFMALLDAAKSGQVAIKKPASLYGAVSQQCLSMIAAGGGRFTRISELHECFSHRDDIDRSTFESILNELGAAGYLQRHGFKNQFGAAEKLHELVDYRMIFGNYPAASQHVDVFHEGKLLGTVPAMNLLRLHAGETVRFSGKCWLIRMASRDRIVLSPTKSRTNAVDFAYGSGAAHLSSFIADRMWQIIHAPVLAVDCIAASQRAHFLSARDGIRAACTLHTIPYVRSPAGIRYYTFAGYDVNRAIAHIAQKAGFVADDLTLSVPSPIAWNAIPPHVADYQGVLDALLEPSEQSLFQQLLPRSLQIREFLQNWLTDQSNEQILTRLSNSQAVEVNAAVFDKVA